MENVTISARWYEDIKYDVPMKNAYAYIENNSVYVEVDVDVKIFEEISTKLGWM